MIYKFRIVIFFIVFGFIGAYASIIDTVIFIGDLKTKDRYLQKVVSHIYKTEYSPQSDSIVHKALEQTRLFNDISVISSQNENDNISIFVVLKERRNFSIDGIGVGLNDMEFGEKSTWAWLRLDASYNNLFGLNQHISWTGQLGRDRFIGTNWFIPIGASPYFFDVGALVGRRPSLVWSWEISPYLNTHLSFGRTIGENQIIYIETAPRYRNYNWVKISAGKQENLYNDKFWEIYEKLYYRFSISDNSYPPLFASFVSVGLSTNKILAYENIEHLELSGDLKQNIPISQRARHSLFLRFRPSLTVAGKRNKYNGFLTGGQDFLRGWGNDILGSIDDVLFGNLLLGTAEYQFHILTLPAMKFGWLSWYHNSMTQFAPQIKGALFFDGGYLFEDINSPKRHNLSTASAGIAIRILQPQMRLGAEFDFAWQIKGDERYLAQNRKVPNIHIGFISHF